MTLFKIIITIAIMAIMVKTIIIIIISTTISQNITEKIEKITYFAFTILGVLLAPKVFYASHG